MRPESIPSSDLVDLERHATIVGGDELTMSVAAVLADRYDYRVTVLWGLA